MRFRRGGLTLLVCDLKHRPFLTAPLIAGLLGYGVTMLGACSIAT